MKKREKEGIYPARRAWRWMGISVALISLVRQDAGRTAVALPSLESAVSTWRTLSSPSLLITVDCPRAGSRAGGGPAGTGGLPFFSLGLGAMESTKRGQDASTRSTDTVTRIGRRKQEPSTLLCEGRVALTVGGSWAYRISRRRGEVETPTSHQPPRVSKAAG